MTDKLWLLPFGPDQIHLPALHSPDSGATHTPTHPESKRYVELSRNSQQIYEV